MPNTRQRQLAGGGQRGEPGGITEHESTLGVRHREFQFGEAPQEDAWARSAGEPHPAVDVAARRVVRQ